MPTMAAIAVLKFDGVTSITYDVKLKASGDGSWAQWRQDTGNTTPFAARPYLAVRTTESAKGVRRVDLVYVYPYFYTDTTTSQVVISPLAVTYRNGVFTAPQGIPVAFLQEAGAQFSNLLGGTLVKSGLTTQTPFV